MRCRPRIHMDGVPLQFVQCGHNRQPCFFVIAGSLRIGALWKGRYKSSLIESDAYLLANVCLVLNQTLLQLLSKKKLFAHVLRGPEADLVPNNQSKGYISGPATQGKTLERAELERDLAKSVKRGRARMSANLRTNSLPSTLIAL